MKTLLYIDCCIRREQSRTRQLAEAFLKELEQRGEYEIQRLCLMDENLSHFSEGFFFQREALIQQGNLTHPPLPLRPSVSKGGSGRHGRPLLGSFLPCPVEGLY